MHFQYTQSCVRNWSLQERCLRQLLALLALHFKGIPSAPRTLGVGHLVSPHKQESSCSKLCFMAAEPSPFQSNILAGKARFPVAMMPSLG
jgi:hypothetical protein